MPEPISVEVCNRQRTRRINLPLLREAIRWLATDWPAESGCKRNTPPPVLGGKLCVHLIAAAAMTGLNGKFLGHAGSTDVISFDYREHPAQKNWCGEIYVSVDDAVAWAPRYRASWQTELTRYVVHGMLHLRGHDDKHPAARRKMKREESRLLKKLSRRFDLSKL